MKKQKHRRIKLVCDKCGTQLRWEENMYPGLIEVEPCPECVSQMDKEKRMMYEKGKLDGIDKMNDFITGCMV